MDVDGTKVFCVGAGKTGTTSLAALFEKLGYAVGDQVKGELLLHEWAVRNFRPIISLAQTAQFFQDMPFSCSYTYQALDMAFPGSKFILSIRSSPEEWYSSLVRFHAMLVGKGRVPTADDLREFPYRYKGWILEAIRLVYGIDETEPYERNRLIAWYNSHNEAIRRYFENRPGSLLVVDISQRNAVDEILGFLGISYQGILEMPHLNVSRD